MVHFIYTEKLILIHWDTEDEKERIKRVFGKNLFVRDRDGKLCLKKNLVSFDLIRHFNAVELPAAQEKRQMEVAAPFIRRRKMFLAQNEDAIAVSKSIKSRILAKQPVVYEGFSARLMNHQKAGALLAGMFDRYGFFYDTGTGKTVMALEIIKGKQVERGAKFLIICPKTIINTAWIEDAASFYPDMRILPLTNDMSEGVYDEYLGKWQVLRGTHQPYYDTKKARLERKKQALVQEAEHFIVNPELFVRQPEYYLRFEIDDKTIMVDGIVFDESALLRNPSSQTSRVMKKLSKQLRYLYILSGKPAPNRLIEYYPQMQLVLPDVLFHAYDQVRDALQQESSLNTGSNIQTAKEGISGPFTRKSFLQHIDYGSITVSKEECIDLPEKAYETRLVELNKVGKEKYASMKHFLRVSIDEEDRRNPGMNQSIRANGILSKLSKLRQIASGFLINGEQVLDIHRCKLNELMLVLNELGESQAIIWCQFRHEIASISKELQKAGKSFATAFSSTKSKDESISNFKAGRAQYLVAHPKTLRYGVTLTNCTYAIYYSISYSYEEYYQSHDRIYRQGQTKPCTYMFLHAKDTIDEIMHTAITEKQNYVEIVENLLKHLHSEIVSA